MLKKISSLMIIILLMICLFQEQDIPITDKTYDKVLKDVDSNIGKYVRNILIYANCKNNPMPDDGIVFCGMTSKDCEIITLVVVKKSDKYIEDGDLVEVKYGKIINKTETIDIYGKSVMSPIIIAEDKDVIIR